MRNCNGMVELMDDLSRREQEVLSWLQQGLSNKEIGMALDISPRTVQKHLQRIYDLLGVESRGQAMVAIRRSVNDDRV